MEKFIEWAFYGSVPKGVTPEEVYTCYQIWCDLFDNKPLNKFEFIELWCKVV